MIPIHDIKPIVEIPDNTIYLYYLTLFVGFVLIIGFVYIIYKLIFGKKEISKELQYFKKLQNLDLKDTKKSAYLISKYGRYLAKTDREKRLIDEIHHDLEQYKYKKVVKEDISIDIQNKFHIFLDSLDVK